MISVRSRRAIAALTTIAAVTLPAVGSAIPAIADTPGGFGLIPTPGPAGNARSYFQLTIQPGRSTTDFAIIANLGSQPERLRLIAVPGETAGNSGSAYESALPSPPPKYEPKGSDEPRSTETAAERRRQCAGIGCWITGLPRTITLGADARQGLAFRVTVPRHIRPGQYLAGITAELATPPGPVKVGSNGHASAQAVIIDQVTVGVAVTVGSLGRLRSALKITGVPALWIGALPRLNVGVHNTGQTFLHASGTITCQAGGRQHAYHLLMETVLPGDRAALAVNGFGLTSGQFPCRAVLRASRKVLATWKGTVSLPARVVTRTYHVAKGVYVSLPVGTMPPWAIALIVVGALIAGLLSVVLLRSRRPVRALRSIRGRKAVLTTRPARAFRGGR
jgi:hypothetical protein